MTGGAVRVGKGIALALARAGMDVAIGYHRSARGAARTVRELQALGARAVAIHGDLARPAEARRLVERAARSLGGLDVLVNNAALFYRTPVATTTAAEWDRLLDLNLRGAFLCAQAAAACMAPGSHIVNIGDSGSDEPLPGYVAYVLSKAGMVTLTRVLAAALRRQGIVVNCVAPGAVLAPPRFPRARWAALTRRRGASLADVATAVTFFATCPAHVTGQVLRVDGGGRAW